MAIVGGRYPTAAGMIGYHTLHLWHQLNPSKKFQLLERGVEANGNNAERQCRGDCGGHSGFIQSCENVAI